MVIPEWVEKLGLVSGGGAIATLAAFLKYLKDRGKEAREDRDSITQGHLKEIERLREGRDSCEDEIRLVHDSYQERMQKVLDGSMELLTKFDEQVRMNFENRRLIHELRNQLAMFGDSVMKEGGRRLYDSPQGVVKVIPSDPKSDIKSGD